MCCGAAAVAGLFTALAPQARAYVSNPCRGELPRHLAGHAVVQQAFDGLDPRALWDVHAHLLGTGDSGSGCGIHADMSRWWHPVEVLRRNFWFTTFSDPTTLPLRHAIGVDRIMVETDFPHNDSSWPDTQAILREQFGDDVTDEEAHQMTHSNAAELYRFPAKAA